MHRKNILLKASSSIALIAMTLSSSIYTAHAETSASVYETITEKEAEKESVESDMKKVKETLDSTSKVAEQYKSLLAELKSNTEASALKCVSTSAIYSDLLASASSNKSNNLVMAEAVRDMINTQGDNIVKLKDKYEKLKSERDDIDDDIESLEEKYNQLKTEEEEAEKEAAKIKASSRVSSTSVSNGNRTYSYSDSDLDLIYAIVGQECSTSYDGALAVITCACNRAISSQWSSYGSDPLSQLMAPNQFCYSIDNYWRSRLGGNVASFVKDAVNDALENGIRNHNYLSFRGYYTDGSVGIGDNYYFSRLN